MYLIGFSLDEVTQAQASPAFGLTLHLCKHAKYWRRIDGHVRVYTED